MLKTWRSLTASLLKSKELEDALSAKHRLSLSEFNALETLSNVAKIQVWMHDLGQEIGLSRSATTRVVARLERRELLNRGTCAEDRRTVCCELTGEGVSLLESATKTNAAIVVAALRALGRHYQFRSPISAAFGRSSVTT